MTSKCIYSCTRQIDIDNDFLIVQPFFIYFRLIGFQAYDQMVDKNRLTLKFNPKYLKQQQTIILAQFIRDERQKV